MAWAGLHGKKNRVRKAAARPPWRLMVLRITCHAVAWFVVLAPTVVQLERGWFPIGDNAFLASQAYQVFSVHTPLVGMFATGLQATGHQIRDPGPLEFWLLAIPVRLAPSIGPLVGAAIVCGGALSVSIEALWHYRGWPAAIVVPLVMGDLLWQANLVFANLIWNAYFGLIFFIATVAVSWVVACGRRNWWPVLVLVASVAAQSHLMFAVTSLALVVVAPLIGRSARGLERSRWLAWGLVVGVIVWTPPLVQEFDSRSGNMTQLLRYGHSLPTTGVGYGLRMLTIAASPKPIMLTHYPSSIFADFRFIEPAGSLVAGVVVLVSLVGIAVYARARGELDLAALAVITVVVAAGTAFGFSSIAKSYALGAAYLVFCLWVLGFLLWITWVWTGATVLRHVLATMRPGASDGTARGVSPRLASAGAAVLILAAAAAAIGGLSIAITSGTTSVGEPAVSDIGGITSDVREKVPSPGPVAVVLRASPVTPNRVDTGVSPAFINLVSKGVAYQLMVDGWRPGLEPSIAPFFPQPLDGWPVVVVTLGAGNIRAVPDGSYRSAE